MVIFLMLAVVAFISILVSSGTIFWGLRKMSHLTEQVRLPDDDGPPVSIIIPVCNEEKNISKAVSSLLNQQYKELEVIVINDLSTDNTAQVLDELMKSHENLIVHDINELPSGWLGKAYAMSKGSALAKGHYLLFADGDVIMEKTTISRAVGYMEKNHLDHLTMTFKNISEGWLLNSLILDTGLGLLFVFLPWRARNRKSKCYVGIGAFNMMRRSVYEAIGGHTGIKMHPVDDMMLGKKIKEHGFLQECLLGYDLIAVPWYDTLDAMINGLQKNLFAVVHYRFLLLPLMLCALAIPTILPVWGLLLGDSLIRIICLGAVLLRLLTFYQGLRLQGLPGWYVTGAFLSPYISCYLFLKTAFVIQKNRGVIWRDQHYALGDLKKTEPLIF